MERLNISLSSRLTTTRPSRRVVWLAAAFLLLAWGVSSWWFTRPDVGRAAPDGTQVILRIEPGAGQWTTVLNQVGDWPAVEGRGLTLRDLAPFTRGDLTLYFSADGRWTTAIRSTASALPHALLDSQGIIVEDAGHGLFLLDDRSEPLVPVSLNQPMPWLKSLFGRRIGDVYIRDDKSWISGRLESSSSGWSLHLPSIHLAQLPWKSLPTGTLAAIATPFPAHGMDLSGITGRMDALLMHFGVPSLQTLTNGALNGHGLFLLNRDEHGVGILWSGPSEALSSENGGKLIATAAALQTPSLKNWILPDQTIAQELEVDPSAVSIQEKTLFGTQVMQAQTRPDESWLFSTHAGSYALSNRETLMKDWLSGKSEGTPMASACVTNGAVFLDLRGLFAASSSSLDHEEPNIVRLAAERFEHISVYNGWFSTFIQFCY